MGLELSDLSARGAHHHRRAALAREGGTMNPNDPSEYEERLRAKHPEKLWWEDWREHKWVVFLVALAVVAMIVVGYVIS
jgi:hypothetical protein